MNHIEYELHHDREVLNIEYTYFISQFKLHARHR